MRDREEEGPQNRAARRVLRVRGRAAGAGAAHVRGSQQRSAARQVRAHQRRERHVPCPHLPRSGGAREPEISAPGATTFATSGIPQGLPHAGHRREHSLAPWRPSGGTAGLDLYAMDRASNDRLKMRVRCLQAGARLVKECIGSSPRSWPDRRCVCRRRRRRSPLCRRNDRVPRRKSRRGRAPLPSAIVGRRYFQCSS